MKPANIEPIHRLGEAIAKSDKSHLVMHKSKQRIDVHNKNHVFYLAKGNIGAYSFDGEVLIFNIFAPEIICLEKLKDHKILNHLRCVTDCELHVINTDYLRDIIDKGSLWSDAFDIISRYLYIYYVRDNNLTRPTAKESIIQYLKYIWGFENTQRESTSVYTFLLERTHISRSLIHKVLSELEKDGVISVSRGILTMCNLP
ncbi:helix-turn-helix domain-containing protein [Enterobacter sp. A103]|uniref:helix-turn-helix domain-containing protein n=1 Tax=Enterobacter sp. A103 TaxID=3102785 RepID=UPI002ACA2F72|nr:helix-turn-helix domain-containing protein [Enterobacter sp. A103]MDZ5641635.1 helix-turn-helix domain-containing protein [Enterobacter sp. A103]